MKVLLAIIFFATYTLTFAQDQSQQNWKSYNKEKYAIKYPSKWAIDTSKAMGTAFIVFAPLESDSDKFQENVNMLTQDLAGQNITLDDYTKISEHQIKTAITDGKIYESIRIKTANGEHHKIIFSGTQGANKLKFEQFYFIKNNYAYVITLTTQADKFEQYRPTGEQILHSFIVK